MKRFQILSDSCCSAFQRKLLVANCPAVATCHVAGWNWHLQMSFCQGYVKGWNWKGGPRCRFSIEVLHFKGNCNWQHATWQVQIDTTCPWSERDSKFHFTKMASMAATVKFESKLKCRYDPRKRLPNMESAPLATAKLELNLKWTPNPANFGQNGIYSPCNCQIWWKFEMDIKPVLILSKMASTPCICHTVQSQHLAQAGESNI